MKEFKKNHRTLIVISTVLLIAVALAKAFCCISKNYISEEKSDEEE